MFDEMFDDRAVTDPHHTPWLERLMGSLAGAVLGLALIAAATLCLAWNEGHAVATASRLAEGARIAVSATGSKLDPDSALLTWLARSACILIMWLGWCFALRLLVVLASVLPVFGRVIGGGVGATALRATLILAPATMAFAWLTYRPLISVLLLAGSLAVVALARRRGRAARGRTAPLLSTR